MPTRIAGFTFLLVGLSTCYMAFFYDVGTFSMPGPGFFPLGVGGFLAILALFYLWEQWRKNEHSFARGVWVRPALTIALSFAYVAVLERLGYLIATFLMLLVFVGGIERQKGGRTIAVAVLGTLGMYLLFHTLLRIPLPKGLLGLGY